MRNLWDLKEQIKVAVGQAISATPITVATKQTGPWIDTQGFYAMTFIVDVSAAGSTIVATLQVEESDDGSTLLGAVSGVTVASAANTALNGQAVQKALHMDLRPRSRYQRITITTSAGTISYVWSAAALMFGPRVGPTA